MPPYGDYWIFLRLLCPQEAEWERAVSLWCNDIRDYVIAKDIKPITGVTSIFPITGGKVTELPRLWFYAYLPGCNY